MNDKVDFDVRGLLDTNNNVHFLIEDCSNIFCNNSDLK